MAIKILAVGKKHEQWVKDGIERYQKRLRKPFDVEWQFLPHSSLQGSRAREEESQRIMNQLSSRDYVVLLDERGDLVDSAELSHYLLKLLEAGNGITMVVGGAYGVTEAVRSRANTVWSLSSLVFPHQLVRLILVEQIYRSQEIVGGRPYHHA